MREIVRISSLVKETDLLMKTNINGTFSVLTESFRIVPAHVHAADPNYKNDPIMKINFTPQRTFVDFEYDTDDKPLNLTSERQKDATDEEVALYQSLKEENEKNRRIRIAVKEFLSRHNQISHIGDFNNGHIPKSQPMATIEIMTQKARQHHLADREKVKVFSIIDAMTWQEQYDLALYYAPYLAGKRRSEVVSGLIGLKGIGTKFSDNGGIMWQKGHSGKGTNAMDFLLNYNANPTVAMKIYVEKAILCGVISKGTGGGYFINGTNHVGRNVQDIVIYFSKDIPTYMNLIQHEVNMRGIGLPEDDLGADNSDEVTLKTRYEKTMIQEMGTTEYKADYARLCDEYQRIVGREVPDSKRKYSVLQEEVKRLQEQEITGKVLNELPTSKLNTAVDPTQTLDLDELKQVAKDMGIKGYQSYQTVQSLKKKIDEVKASQIPVMGE